MNRTRSALALGLVLAAAAGAAWSQPPTAPGTALGSPSQPKVSAPPAPPAVQAGAGGGAGSSAGGASVTSAAALAASGQALGQHVRGLNWPGGPVGVLPTGLNHFRMELKTADGQILVNEQSGPLLMTTGTSITAMKVTGPSPFLVSYGLRGDATTVTGYASYMLASGEIVDPPPITLPIGGGSQTVALPGGASMTLTLDGAHPITDAERAQSAQMVNLLQNSVRAAAAQAAQEAQGPQAKTP